MDLCAAKDKYAGEVASLGQRRKRSKERYERRRRVGEAEIKRGREEESGGGRIWLVKR